MICAVCGAEVKADRFPLEALAFCSKVCLLMHIKAQKPLTSLEIQGLGIRPADGKWGNHNCFSVKLSVAFRSWFECMVAEDLVLKEKLEVAYEPHLLPIDSKKTYLPDFYFPGFGTWLEVKGEWLGSGRSKFCTALHLLGRNRLVIIPDSYKSWFKPKRKIA